MTDRELMRECIRLARCGRARVSPNPMVGAVLARGGRIIATGYHRRYGGPHAEIDCLSRFSGSLVGTTLYVNLEPCAHQGKTAPCAHAIVEAGIPEVVVGMKDPNPLVSGKGIRILRRGGVRVRLGILHEEAQDLNRIFIHQITRRRPYVHVKLAQSLDGFIAPREAGKYWLTGKASRVLVHRWRAEADAILVGAGTIAADDPQLNVRLVRGRDPVVVVLDGQLSISPHARIFRTGARVLVLAGRDSLLRKERRLRAIASRGGVVLGLPARNGRINLSVALRTLYRHNLVSIIVEGGAEVFAQFARAGLIDRLSVFIAPVLLGEGIPAFGHRPSRTRRVHRRIELSARRVGGDMLVESVAK